MTETSRKGAAGVPRLQLLDEVTWDGEPIPGERTHALLRALAEAGSRGRSDAGLVEEVWGEDSPANPAKALQVVVSRARRATCADAIERTATGYRLALSADEVDLWSLRPSALRLAAAGDYPAALPLLDRLVGEGDRGDDEVVEAWLRSIGAVLGTPAALDRYEEYRSGLADRLGVDPSPALRELHRELLARDRPVRSGLRYDSTTLIGRDDDIVAVSATLRAARVVTILGPGGLGKTRLAQVVARGAEQPVVHFVELVGVSSADDVVGEVGSALGVRDSVSGRRVLTPSQRADVRARIAGQLAQAPTLLVLDNCEHVIEAAASLVAFLVASVPDLRVLTTSRAPLAIGAEQVYPLGQLRAEDGSTLFAERARSARPGVELPADAVAELVARLDGLPLALELAAVKVRVMSVPDIVRRLNNRFALLTGGDRSAPDRHQTLLAVIDWSWNLLAEPEREALRMLSIFHDGFTVEAGEAMLGYDALRSVAELVDQSLLTVTETDDGVRYRMLEMVREFGRMQLVDAGEEGKARLAQRAWAREYADRQADRLYGVEQFEAMDALRVEEANLADVLRHAIAELDREPVISTFVALASFWAISGDHARVLTMRSALLPVLDDWMPPPELLDRTRFAVGFSLLASAMTGGADAARLRELAVRLGVDSPCPELRALLTVLIAINSPNDPEWPAACRRMLSDPDRRARQVAYQFLCHERENSGYLAEALEAGVAALDLADDQDGPWTRATLHTQLAGLHAQVGDVATAAQYAELALPVLRRLGADDDCVQSMAILTVAAIDAGHFDEAERLVAEIGRLAGRGMFGASHAQHAARGQLALAQGRVEEALAYYREGIAAMRESRLFPGSDELMPWLAHAEAVALATYARYVPGSPEGADLYAGLAAKINAAIAESRPFLDLPVIGGILFALGLWGLRAEVLDAEPAVRLLVVADRFGYNRFALGMRWADARQDAERVAPGVLARIESEYGDRRGPDLLGEARAVTAHIFLP
ncbi:MAG: AAA family ATPase [Nocardioides sp.]|uniref:ATP-binding protein n=1 Tax=Nocardioides sp. TaxID=35761 RepID=UPI0039E23916